MTLEKLLTNYNYLDILCIDNLGKEGYYEE